MAAIKERVVKPDNLLLEYGMDVFHLIMPLIGDDRGASTGQELRAKLFQCFDAFEKRCYESQMDSNSVNDAKYAMAAFVDEKVMSSAWPHKLSWMGKPLQLEFFGDNLAGEGFFKKLTKLRQSGDRNIDVLEVYFLCLQLGFEGMFRMRGLEQLQALQVDLRTQIADSRNRVPRTLSPHGVASGSFMEKVQRVVPYWVIALITVSIIFAAYLLFVVLLSNKADNVREVLQDDGRRIQTNLEREVEKKLPVVVPPPVVEAPKPEPTPKPRAEKRKPAPHKVEVAEPPPPPPPKPKPEPKPEPKPKMFTPIMGF
jgi:type VI secretion system protein ImpK